MELTLAQLLGLAERAVTRSAPPGFATNAFLRRLGQLQLVAQNKTLRGVRIELAAADPGEAGLQRKEPCPECAEKKRARAAEKRAKSPPAQWGGDIF